MTEDWGWGDFGNGSTNTTNSNSNSFPAQDASWNGRSTEFRRSAPGSERSNNFGGPQRGRRGRGFTSTGDRDVDWRNTNRDGGTGEFADRSSRQSTKLKVPSSDVGRIIGRGGAKIRELEEQSGARIKVLKDDGSESDSSGESTVLISGPQEAIDKADKLIKELLEPRDSRSYGGNSRSQPDFGNQKFQAESAPAVDDYQPVDWAGLLSEADERLKTKWLNAAPVKKDFYFEDPAVAGMHPEDARQFRLSQNNIMVTHHNPEDTRRFPNPVKSFEQAFAHYPEILDEIRAQAFEYPSPVQCQAWPILLKGIDLIGIAQTGTGKTLAFLLPALIHLDCQPTPRESRAGPSVLIMAPTRELAQQIEREAKKYHYRGIKAVCVYGGGNRREQISVVAKGVEIVIATPGRLLDLVQAGALNLSSVTYVVLDEADRMLDLGFEPQIRKVLIDVRPDRQTVMTSATWPEGVRRLAKSYMDNPMQICVGTLDLAAVHSVTQIIEFVEEDDKRDRLYEFVEGLAVDDKVIVFVGKKARADDLASDLSLKDVICQCIHGDREQVDREQALEDLRSGSVRILIATDVASRGIDIKDVTHIFNFDFPRHMEEYVHRVGRTGRAGSKGIAISLVAREDWSKAEDLIGILQEAGQEVPQELLKMAERFGAYKERKEAERVKNTVDMGRFGRRDRDDDFGGGGFGGGGRRGGRGGQGGGRRDDFGRSFY